MNPKNSKGAVLITIIIVLVFLTTLGLSLFTFLFSRFDYTYVQLDRLKALYLAEAGISKTLYELRTNIDINDDGLGNIPPTKLGAGTYEAKHNFQTSVVTAVGEVNKTKRIVQIKYSAL